MKRSSSEYKLDLTRAGTMWFLSFAFVQQLVARKPLCNTPAAYQC